MSSDSHPSSVHEVIYKWKIENFTFATEDYVFYSPPLFLKIFLNTTWCLSMHKKADVFANGVDFSLKRSETHGPCEVEIEYEISVISPDGSLNCIASTQQPVKFLMGENIYQSRFKPKGYILGNDLRDRLNGDTLTICCRMWSVLIESRHIFTYRTFFETYKHSCNWVIDEFCSSLEVESNRIFESVIEEPGIPVRLFWIDKGLVDERIQIEFLVGWPLILLREYITCHIFVLDAKGNTAISERDAHIIKNTKEVWKFPSFIKRNWLITNKDLYLPNNSLNLRIEFERLNKRTENQFSYESSSFKHTNALNLSLDQNIDFNKNIPHEKLPFTNTLKEGLLHLYQEGKFCDIILQTDDSRFPVHKAVLCAQSSVFTDKFEQDSKENQSSTVHISDINSDTVRRMLWFMYAGTVDSPLPFESTLKLYFASITYKIDPLTTACKTLLRTTLNVLNFAEALVLADSHQDEDLKSLLREFFLEHDSEILDSDVWKTFMREHLKLAADTMHLVFLQKLKS